MKRTSFFILLACIAMAFGSCLKSDDFLDTANTQPVIEFPSYASGANNANGNTLSDTTPVVHLDTAIALNLASPQVINKDYKVTVQLDTAAIAAYNAANDDTYEPLPASLITIPSATVTIPANHRIGRFGVSLALDKSDYNNHKYAVAFTITDAPGLVISSNAKTFIWLLDLHD
ncbi:DUF1735 domain-containing protein [Deminuibacter soli]|nr:DUF1735 domain-containing protein [Deminuibacter soli]